MNNSPLSLWRLIFFKKIWANPSLFFIFVLFVSLQFKLKKESIDVVLGIRTRGRRMVGKDRSTELCRPPWLKFFSSAVCESVLKLIYRQCDQIGRLIALWATFSKTLATIYLPKSPTFLGNFCRGGKIFHFSGEIIFGQLLLTFGNYLLVTLRAYDPVVHLLL